MIKLTPQIDIKPFGQILLIRHGATIANVAGRYCGLSDYDLTEEGLSQVKSLKKELEFLDMCSSRFNIICSPLQRCQHTAKLLFPGQKYRLEPALTETDFGLWEGKTYAQLQDDPLFIEWLESMPAERPAAPGGESGADVCKRLLEVWRSLSADISLKERLVLVTHGGVIMYLLSLLANSPASFYQWQLKPGTAWLVDKGGYRLVDAANRCT